MSAGIEIACPACGERSAVTPRPSGVSLLVASEQVVMLPGMETPKRLEESGRLRVDFVSIEFEHHCRGRS